MKMFSIRIIEAEDTTDPPKGWTVATEPSKKFPPLLSVPVNNEKVVESLHGLEKKAIIYV